MTKGTVQIAGTTISYRRLGEGRDIVLLHGLAANKGFWNPALLMPLARNYRVTVVDLRGHGQSGMPPRGYTSADMAGDILGLLDYLNIKRTAIIGHSFGGVVGLHMAMFAPHRISALVLADTRIRVFEPTLTAQDLRLNNQFCSKLEQLGIKLPDDETETGLWLLERLASPEWQTIRETMKDSDGFLPRGGWCGIRSNRAAEQWLKLLRETTARQDFSALAGLTKDRLLGIHLPILAICGENSTARRSAAGLQEFLPNCQTALISDAGHFFPLTHPHIFLANVLQFIPTTREQERRSHQRLFVDLELDLRMNETFAIPAATMNLSKSGLLIQVTQRLKASDRIAIFPSVACHHPLENMILDGKIVRVERDDQSPYLYGVELQLEELQKALWLAYFAEQTSVELS